MRYETFQLRLGRDLLVGNGSRLDKKEIGEVDEVSEVSEPRKLMYSRI